MVRSFLGCDAAMLTLAQTFIERSRVLVSQAELHALLEDICRELGFRYFALIHHTDLRKANVINLNNYPPPWVEYFIKHQLFRLDPVVQTCCRANAGFFWADMHHWTYINSMHREIMRLAAREGVKDGLTIPGCVLGEFAGSCSLAAPAKGDAGMPHLMAGQLIGSFAFEAARRLLRERSGVFPAPPRLNRRQRECAILAGQGMQAMAIAHRLGLSYKTVTNYLDAARKRYGVHSCDQLLIHALLNGDIALTELDTRR